MSFKKNWKQGDSKYDILIIDYDEPTLEILNCFFELRGYSSCCLRSGTRGLKKLGEINPKLILLNIMLPDITGFELCKKIKFNHFFNHIPVLYLVSILISKVQEKLEETKADGFIMKPFNFNQISFLFNYL